MKEKWTKVTPDPYNKRYLVSSLGRIKNKETGALLNPGIDRDGYPQLGLYWKGEHKVFKLHRLVALAFIPNPNNYPCVNHIDENKQNNSVENLEWRTVAYNNAYGGRTERAFKTLKNKKLNMYENTVEVLAVNPTTYTSMIFPSVKSATRFFNVDDRIIYARMVNNKNGMGLTRYKGFELSFYRPSSLQAQASYFKVMDERKRNRREKYVRDNGEIHILKSGMSASAVDINKAIDLIQEFKDKGYTELYIKGTRTK